MWIRRGFLPVQLRSVAIHEAAALGVAHIADGLALVQAGGYVRVILGNRDDSRLLPLTLAQGVAPAAAASDDPVIGEGAAGLMAVQENAGDDRVFVYSAPTGLLRHATVNATAFPGLTNGTSADGGYVYDLRDMLVIERGATDLAALVLRNQDGVGLYTLSERGSLTSLGQLEDGPKSYLRDVSDLAAVTVDGRSYLLAASASEHGISLFEIAESGTASLVDAYGAADGLPIAGPSDLLALRLDGVQFVVVAATLSSSLSVLRVNDMGVMFATDHVVDTRTTRFADVVAVDGFGHNGRAFVVAAGSDKGLTIQELLPDGRLSLILTEALETGAGIANVTGIKAGVWNDRATILLTHGRGDRLYQFEIDLAGLGDLIRASGGQAMGTARDDRILGSAAAETLAGGAGEDYLHDGAGVDRLTGGAGADVFVFARDGQSDRIEDFQDGQDRIDLSDWGRIYTSSVVQMSQTAGGVTISYGSESLTVLGAGLTPAMLTDADFLF